MSSNTNIHKDFITGFSVQDNEIPNKFIISFKTSNQPNFSSRAKMVLEDLGLPSSNSKLYKNINMMSITLPEKSRRQLTRKLYKRDDIRVEADRLISIAAPPPGKGKNKDESSDGGGGETITEQWTAWNNSINPNLERLQEDGTKWNTLDKSKRIFILDTGISDRTNDLNIDESRSIDFTGSNRRIGWRDQNGHGTHVAGTAAAVNDDDGIAGIAAGATVVSVKVLDRRGQGTVSSVVAGINYVAGQDGNGNVANLSLGGGISDAIDNAVIMAATKENPILFAIAAGNDDKPAANTSPARAGDRNLGIYTIAAHDKFNQRAEFSNFGVPTSFSAPGVSITSLGIEGTLIALDGTSMASPAAAGQLFLTGSLQGDVPIAQPDGNNIPAIQITEIIG